MTPPGCEVVLDGVVGARAASTTACSVPGSDAAMRLFKSVSSMSSRSRLSGGEPILCAFCCRYAAVSMPGW